MKTMVNELSGAALDWAVNRVVDQNVNTPSTSWSECGPLIESLRVTVDFNIGATDNPDYDPEPWISCVGRETGCYYGKTPLIAACRSIVASHCSYDHIEVPDHLVTQPGGDS